MSSLHDMEDCLSTYDMWTDLLASLVLLSACLTKQVIFSVTGEMF